MPSATNVTCPPFCAIFRQMAVLQAGKTESFVQCGIPLFVDHLFQEFRTGIKVMSLFAGEVGFLLIRSATVVSLLEFAVSGTLWSPLCRYCSPISLEVTLGLIFFIEN